MRRAALTTTALAAAMTLFAAPALASAAPVAYALTWDSNTLYQLEEGASPVEVADAVGPISVTGLDFDTDGNGYAITYDGIPELWAVDIDGGATLVGQIADAASTPLDDCTALDYTDGVITIACDGLGTDENVLGTVDPTTAVFTLIQTLSDRVASLAHNPIDDTLYGFTYDETVLAISAGSDTNIGATSGVIWGADFDSTGALWVATDDAAATTLLGWDLVTFEPDGFPDGEFVENISVYEAAVAEEPVAEVPQPELAATGLSDGTATLVGLGGALALLTGLGLMLTARRTARMQ